jgi:hypothetical protein
MDVRSAALLLCASALLGTPANAIEPADLGGWLRDINHEEPVCCKTLLHWNNGAEMTGGPPGWDEPLASDRPDFTEASSTVGRGVSQLEMGYTYFYDDGAGAQVHAHSYPEFLLRQGFLADWLELRVGWTYLAENERIGLTTTSANGSDDLYLGIKLGLTPQQGILPEMSLMPQMRVPLGSDFTAGEVRPGLSWLYGWEVSEFLSTGGSTQANLAIDDGTGDEFTEVAQSWTIGYSLGENLGAYTEWFAFFPAGGDTARTEHYFDGGFIYNWSNDLQFDVRVGKGVSGASTDFFTGAGAVVRF